MLTNIEKASSRREDSDGAIESFWEATLVETEDEFCGVNGGGVAGNGASNGVGGGTGNGDMGSSLSSLPSGGARGRYSGEMV